MDPDRGFCLGRWRVLPRRGLIEPQGGGGEHVNIEPRPMAVLVELARAGDRFVSRETLREQVWKQQHLSDEVINVAIGNLRKALGDDARNPKYIQTMAGRGYRLVADIEPLDDPVPLAWRKKPVPLFALAALLILAFYLGIGTEMQPAQPLRVPVPLTEVIADEADRDAYLKARFVVHHGDVQNIPEAQGVLIELADRYPSAAVIHAEVAEAYMRRYQTGARRPATLADATAAAERALELDDTNPVALGVTGQAHYLVDWDLAAAEADYRKGLEGDPASADLRRRLSRLLGAEGRFEEAWDILGPLKEMDPEAYGTTDTAYLLYLEGRHDEAIELLNELLRIRWNPGDVYRLMAMCFEAQGEFEKAYQATISHYQFRAYDKSVVAKMESAYATGGYPGLSRFFADWLIGFEAQGRAQSPVRIARHLVLAGDQDAALIYLARALTERDPALLTLKVSPEFAVLAASSRFSDIVYAMANAS